MSALGPAVRHQVDSRDRDRHTGWVAARLVLLTLTSALAVAVLVTPAGHASSLLAMLAIPLGLWWLILLTAGPQPWRATRWAWFWLSGSVVGAIAFVLLSGPLPRVRGPRRPERRLTGGWALLIGVVLAGIAPTWLQLTG
jgi:uncharacterized membrane protein HdeD (DUF308 family)